MKIVPGKLEALPEAAWDTTMNIGLKGAFLVSQAAAKHMIAQKSGVIVNIASIAGLFPYNWAGAYSVVKAGLIMLTKLQAMEWAPYGIRANAITPGYIRTPGTEAMYADPEIYEGRRKGVPMGRVGSGEDIAGPAMFLASDEAQYTTGSVVGADGGQAVGYFLTVPGAAVFGRTDRLKISGSLVAQFAAEHAGERRRDRAEQQRHERPEREIGGRRAGRIAQRRSRRRMRCQRRGNRDHDRHDADANHPHHEAVRGVAEHRFRSGDMVADAQARGEISAGRISDGLRDDEPDRAGNRHRGRARSRIGRGNDKANAAAQRNENE